MSGLIIPEPFATPERVTVFPPILIEVEYDFSTRSVVKIPLATLLMPFLESELTSILTLDLKTSKGRNSPITPVENGNTCSGLISSSSAR